MNQRAVGKHAEDAAAVFLTAQGYVILARNYTIRGAEIDLITREGAVLAFVEVKHRSTTGYALPRESVTAAKQRRIIQAALRWMQENGEADAPVRFDVVESTPAGMTLIRGAFDASV